MPAELRRTNSGSGPADEGVFLLGGDLDFASVPELADAAEHFAAHTRVRLDLSAVAHSDSAGVALLVDWLRQAQAAGVGLSFANVPAQMRAIIRVCGLEALLAADASGS